MMNLLQAVVETAKQGSVTVVVPTAFLSSAATLLLYKGVPFVIGVIRGKPRYANGNGGSVQAKIEELEKNPKSGEGETCREHGEAISALEESKKNTYGWLARIDGKIDRLLERKG
jgi:hypothetical protein